MTSPRYQLAVALAAAFLAAAAVPAPGFAATFVVSACDAAADGFTNNAWTYSESAAGRFEHGDGCADAAGGEYAGLYMREKFSVGSNAPSGTSAYWTFTAAPTTTISALNYSRHLRTFGDDGWRAELVATPGGPLEVCQTSGMETECARGTTGGQQITFSGLSATQLQVGGRCLPQAGATSCTHGSSLHSLITSIYSASVTVSDATFPTASAVGGTIAAGGWLRGVRTVAGGGSDATGIARLELVRGVSALRDDQRSCDFTKPAPCVNPGGQVDASWADLDTATLSDGTHALAVRARDAAGNTTTGPALDVQIDNTAPAPPVGLTAAGGEGWSASGSRSLSWSLPGGQAAPIGAATVTRCLQASCASAAAASTTSASVSLPSPGEWTAKVHLTDEAGNGDGASAATVALRYDPDPPPAPTLGAPQPASTSSSPVFTVPLSIADPGPAPVGAPEAELCRADATDCQQLTGEQPGQVSFTVAAAGSWLLRVRARDAAGNVSPPATTTVTYAPTEPTPSPTAPASPTVTATATPAPTAAPTPTATATPTPRRRVALRIFSTRRTRSGLRVRGRRSNAATGRVTVIFSARVGGRARRVSRRVTVRDGRIALTLRLPRALRARRGLLVVRYAGDEHYLPRSVSRTVAATKR